MAIGPTSRHVMNEDYLWQVVKILPTDYKDYGGEVERWTDPEVHYPDCSAGCYFYRRLAGVSELNWDADWGVCTSTTSPRAGLLTWEHQAGQNCFKPGK